MVRHVAHPHLRQPIRYIPQESFSLTVTEFNHLTQHQTRKQLQTNKVPPAQPALVIRPQPATQHVRPTKHLTRRSTSLHPAGKTTCDPLFLSRVTLFSLPSWYLWCMNFTTVATMALNAGGFGPARLMAPDHPQDMNDFFCPLSNSNSKAPYGSKSPWR